MGSQININYGSETITLDLTEEEVSFMNGLRGKDTVTFATILGKAVKTGIDMSSDGSS